MVKKEKEKQIKPVDSLQGIEELKEEDIVEVSYEEPYVMYEDFINYELFSDFSCTETVYKIGYLVKDTSNFISICPTHTVGVMETPAMWREIINIPKKCVNEIKKLKRE